MASAIRAPEIRERLPNRGYEPVADTSEQFASKYRADLATCLKEARIPLQD